MRLMKTILQMTDYEIMHKIQSNELKISVIGIGRIGLPTALSFAKSGLPTTGIDINKKLVDMINSGDFPLNDEPGYDTIFNQVIREKKFSSTTSFSEGVNSSDVIVLSLPTPMNEKNIPDYSALLSVAKKLNEEMNDGKLIIIESTVEPGFVENEFLKIIEGTNKKNW